MARRGRPSKITTLIIGLIVVSTGGYIAWTLTHHKASNPNTGAAKYVSLAGGYLFNVPAKSVVDDTILPGITIVYTENSPPQAGKSLEELYGNGTVAIQPIAELTDNNTKAFKEYVNNKLAVELRQSLRTAVDVREAKHGNLEAFRVFALAPDGKRVKAIYVLNISRPILMVAKEESDPLRVVGDSIEDLKTSNLKASIDVWTKVAKDVAESLQKKDTSNIKKRGSEQFSKTMTDDKLKAALAASAKYLNGSITVAGGSFKGNDVVAQLIFQPSQPSETPRSGVLTLHKEGRTWKLHDMQLPQ